MAVVHPPARSATIDIAGSAWPVYKLDALLIGVATCLVLALITGSPQIAVLVAATLGAARWLIGLASVRRGEPGQRHA
ncbi:hypothetical protein [Nocardia abscessus]|uniref:Uncharacterized protein n=1 Tax=Nocardia abscessus TaxID=120957 RepID=A0ABS0C994_9NOCA|nr:hypothetical protein [Nocardia abscessus]MBF6226929.1 hypothetical protein [Nocardia abscessus]